MRITLNLEEKLLEELMNLSNAKSESAAVSEAISEYVRLHKFEQLKKLSGQVEIDETWENLRDLERNGA